MRAIEQTEGKVETIGRKHVWKALGEKKTKAKGKVQGG